MIEIVVLKQIMNKENRKINQRNNSITKEEENNKIKTRRNIKKFKDKLKNEST